MENATKALLIAGGILFTMLIIALVLYAATSMQDMAEAQDRKTLAKQTEEFNKSYQAYNKTRMYGTDVITVVNKAIDHNTSIAVATEDPYYINVIINTTKSFETTGTKINNSLSSDANGYENDMSSADFNRLGITTYRSSLPMGQIELGTWNGDELIMKQGILAFFNQSENNDVKKDGNYTYYIYSGLTNFKRAIFKCESMDYNQKTGRINSITFTQISV